MAYQALYRKFRPAAFEDVKGQGHIVETLKNQIMADRIGHAYLFCGTRGTGKTTIAKIFARAVNCEHPVDGSPCGECKTCKAIASGTSLNVIEIDAASNNGVDNIREIVDEVTYSPQEGRYKVYIIDEVHMLSIGAFNALLKTLEEPPEYVIFILATTEVHKIPITILSRCQRYDFKRIDMDTITDRLRELMQKENIEVEDRALRYVAKTADGSLRDALSLLDQCLAFHFGKPLTYEMALDVLGAVDSTVFSRLLRYMLEQNVIGCITLLEEIVMQGRELAQFIADYTWYLRNLLLVKNCADAEDVLDVSAEHLALLKEEAEMAELHTIMRLIRIFSELSGQLRFSMSKRVMIEMAMIKACRPQMETDTDSVLDRIRTLEQKLESGQIAVNFVAPDAQAGAVAKKAADLPDASKEDITKVVQRFHELLMNFPRKGAKAMMKSASVREGSQGDLQIYLNSIEYNVITKDTTGLRETLNAYINEAIGKKVVINYFPNERGKQNDSEDINSVDFGDVISMPVNEVEE